MPGRFSAQSLEQIRAASDIVEVISAHLPLKRAGANFLALCPFHKEKTPSFNVNPQKQIFYCFGCHKGGDVFAFIQAYDNVDFTEAVRRLAERARIPLEWEGAGGEPQARHLKETLWQIHEQIAQRWQRILAQDAGAQGARDYLAKRRVSPEAVQLFRLGYAPEAWDDTVNWAKAKGYDLDWVEQAGLILHKDREGKPHFYDRFRGRLIFPICDEAGRVIGFSGRILTGDAKAAKYVNSPETPIFAKRKVFFGLDKSKRAILEAQCAIICEGQLDLIACFMAGITNVVAPQGTALTADHARLLKRYTNEVLLCFDSDLAGQSAAVRVLDDLLAAGLAIRVATVPAPHDPDSFIKEFGGPAFRQLIEQAEGFFDFYLNHLCARHDPATDKGRLAILKAMGEAVRKTGNLVLVDKYAQKTALRLNVGPDAVRGEFAKIAPPKVPEAATAEEESAEPEPVTRPSTPEFWLLKLLFLPETEVAWVAAHLDPAWLQHPGVRQIVALRLGAHEGGHWQGLAPFMGQIPEASLQNLLSEALSDRHPIPQPSQQLSDLLLRLRNLAIDRHLANLIQRAAQPETAEAERQQLLQQQQDLRRQKRQPLSPIKGKVA